jgi:glyoxylase-like metal-dependent hydrolase (beta-lactamase superfamily II)
MGRVSGVIAVVVVAAVALIAINVYSSIHEFSVDRITDDVYMVSGFGSNVGILATGAGSLVVDTMTFRSQGEELLGFAEELGRGPIQAIVNTHYHLDHTHGNPAFPAGTRVVSTARTFDYLKHFDWEFWEGKAAATLPNETFSDFHEMKIGNKTIQLHYLGRGHTGGDLVVLFVEDRVLHAGDLFFNARYPNIDLEAGGSVREWDATLDRVLALDFDQVIPGHGPATDRNGVLGFQLFIRELAALGAAAAEKGWTVEQAQASSALKSDAGYEEMSIPFVMKLDRDFVIRRAWEEATGAVTPTEVPAF